MQKCELEVMATQAKLQGEEELVRSVRDYERKKKSTEIGSNELTKDLLIAKLKSDLEDLREELEKKSMDIKRLNDLAEKSSQSSVDDVVGRYFKSPFQDELQYWREQALKSSQRGSGALQLGESAVSFRLNSLEEELNMRERDLNSKQEFLLNKEKELTELKFSLQAKEGQIRMKENQLKMTKQDMDRERVDLEIQARDLEERSSAFTFSGPPRTYLDCEMKKEIKDYENQISNLEKVIEELREENLETKKNQTDLQAKNHAYQNQIKLLQFQNETFEVMNKKDLLSNHPAKLTLDLKQEADLVLKPHQLVSFLNKVTSVLEKFEEMQEVIECCSPLISSLCQKILSWKDSPHIQLSLLPTLLSNLLSLQVKPIKDEPLFPQAQPVLENTQKTETELNEKGIMSQTESLEGRLLFALKTLETNYRDMKKQSEADRKITEALLEGWDEDNLRQAVTDTRLLFQAQSKIEANDGDTSIANKKIQAALICVSKIASCIGKSHLSKAIKGAQFQISEHARHSHRKKESREQSLALDENLLFLGQQVGRSAQQERSQ